MDGASLAALLIRISAMDAMEAIVQLRLASKDLDAIKDIEQAVKIREIAERSLSISI